MIKRRKAQTTENQSPRLQVGCGRRKMEGWCNVDLNPAWNPDVLVDVTKGLPFEDESFDLIYSEDFIEHIDLEQGRAFLRECHRVLRPGGWLRLLTPDLAVVCHHYFERNPMTMLWYRDEFGSRTAAEMVNEAMRMGGHTFLYDEETLSLILREASFGVRPTGFDESSQPELAGIDLRDSGFSIYLDCWKLPGGEMDLPAWNAAAISRLWRSWGGDLHAIEVGDESLRLDSTGDDPQLIGPVISLPEEKPLWCVVEMSVVAHAADQVQLFWRGETEPFDARRMVEMPIDCDGTRQSIGLRVPPMKAGGTCQLRIDPLGQPGQVRIHSISICEAPPKG